MLGREGSVRRPQINPLRRLDLELTVRRSEVNLQDKNVKARHAAYEFPVADHLRIATSDVLSSAPESSMARFSNPRATGLWHHSTRTALRGLGWRNLKDRVGCDLAVSWIAVIPLGDSTFLIATL